METILKDVILETTSSSLQDIRPKKRKGKREKDHLFVNENKQMIYYAEIKSNLNLDTEKCKTTALKCLQIQSELQLEYPKYEIKMFLLGSRYLFREQIPLRILSKYHLIKNHVMGVNDYFGELGVPFQFEGEMQYVQFLNQIVEHMFDPSSFSQ